MKNERCSNCEATDGAMMQASAGQTACSDACLQELNRKHRQWVKEAHEKAPKQECADCHKVVIITQRGRLWGHKCRGYAYATVHRSVHVRALREGLTIEETVALMEREKEERKCPHCGGTGQRPESRTTEEDQSNG